MRTPGSFGDPKPPRAVPFRSPRITDYAVRFTAALAAGNVFAVQFHPEKSQRPGLQLLWNFFDWRP